MLMQQRIRQLEGQGMIRFWFEAQHRPESSVAVDCTESTLDGHPLGGESFHLLTPQLSRHEDTRGLSIACN